MVCLQTQAAQTHKDKAVATWREQWMICGVPGSGKSHLAFRLATQYTQLTGKDRIAHFDLEYKQRLWVYDPAMQYRTERNIKGFPFCGWEDRDSYPLIAFGDEHLDEAIEDAERCTFLFDETMTIEGRDTFERIKRLCVLRRHRNVDLIFCTQSPKTIPKVVMRMCSQFVCFHIHDADDIQQLRTMLDKEDLVKLSTLSVDRHERIHRDFSGR